MALPAQQMPQPALLGTSHLNRGSKAQRQRLRFFCSAALPLVEGCHQPRASPLLMLIGAHALHDGLPFAESRSSYRSATAELSADSSRSG
jgi:hypothetical protein